MEEYVIGDNADAARRWPLRVISLPGDAERRGICAAALAARGVPFTFFDAVDAGRLADAEVAAAYDPALNAREYKRPLSRAEVACYLSHLALWREAAAAPQGGLVVLEDDFAVVGDLPGALAEMARHDLSDCLVKLNAPSASPGPVARHMRGGMSLTRPDTIPSTTVGYFVGSGAAARLVRSALPFGRPVDIDIKHWWKAGVEVLLLNPQCLVEAKVTGSRIGRSRHELKPKGPLGPLRRLARNLRYQFDYRTQRRAAAGRRAAIATVAPLRDFEA